MIQPGIMPFAYSSLAKIVTASITTGANTIAHGLGRAPVGHIVIADDARPVNVRAYRNAALTLTSAGTIAVAHDFATYDDGSDFASGVLTAPHTGWYNIESTLWFEAGAGGDRCYLGARINGTVAAAGSRIAAYSAVNMGCSIACRLRVTAGQTVDISAQPNSTAASMPCVTGGTLTWLMIKSDDSFAISSYDSTNIYAQSGRERTVSVLVW